MRQGKRRDGSHKKICKSQDAGGSRKRLGPKDGESLQRKKVLEEMREVVVSFTAGKKKRGGGSKRPEIRENK